MFSRLAFNDIRSLEEFTGEAFEREPASMREILENEQIRKATLDLEALMYDPKIDLDEPERVLYSYRVDRNGNIKYELPSFPFNLVILDKSELPRMTYEKQIVDDIIYV